MKTVKRTQEVWKELELKDGSKVKALVQEEIKVPFYNHYYFEIKFNKGKVEIIKYHYISEHMSKNKTLKEFVDEKIKLCENYHNRLLNELKEYTLKKEEEIEINKKELNALKEGRYKITEKTKE